MRKSQTPHFIEFAIFYLCFMDFIVIYLTVVSNPELLRLGWHASLINIKYEIAEEDFWQIIMGQGRKNYIQQNVSSMKGRSPHTIYKVELLQHSSLTFSL